MFTDEIEITLIAGNGGDGRVSFFPGKKSGPDGGTGGDGGSLFVRACKQVSNLNELVGKITISAQNGTYGGKKNMTGANGSDLILDLPIGSLLTDTETGGQAELTFDQRQVLICKGGTGGRGNIAFKSGSDTTPKTAEEGTSGQKRHFKIVVKLIADLGLIGLPNAGKSSLLNSITNANVKVANYPFTTLAVNLGSFYGKIIADIPGLIEGASGGKGLGIGFLKHIEKVSLLLHCISSESENVVSDYKVTMSELEKFNPILSSKKQVILLTKSDLCTPENLKKKIKQLKKLQEVIPVSIYNPDSLNNLEILLR